MITLSHTIQIRDSDKEIKLNNYNENRGDVIPKNITKIHINDNVYNFNNISNSVNILHLRGCYNQIDNLPNNIRELILINQSNTINNLPLSILTLGIGRFYNKRLLHLPEYIIKLAINFNENSIINNTLSSNIFCVSVKNKCNNLPNSIFVFSNCKKNILYNNLPKNIIKIMIDNDYNKKLNNLPAISQIVYNFNKPIFKYLKTIEKIQITSLTKNSIENLPLKFQTLSIKKINNYNLDMLNEGVKILKFIDTNYDKNIKINDLPSSIEEIWLYKDQSHIINPIYKHKLKFL